MREERRKELRQTHKSEEEYENTSNHEGLQTMYKSDDNSERDADDDRGEGVQRRDASSALDGLVERDDEDGVCRGARSAMKQY